MVFLAVFQESKESREPKKPPTQIKRVCTNSLRKLFCLFSVYCKGERGTICTNCPEIVCANCLCKLFLFGWVVFWVGLPFAKEKKIRVKESLKTHTPQIWGVKISPPKFRKRPSKNTVKQVIFEDSPLEFWGGVNNNPCFFGWFSLPFSRKKKRQGEEDQGKGMEDQGRSPRRKLRALTPPKSGSVLKPGLLFRPRHATLLPRCLRWAKSPIANLMRIKPPPKVKPQIVLAKAF